MTEVSGIRFKRLRLGIDRLQCIVRGWRFAPTLPHPLKAWPTLGRFVSPIRQRPELGEQNKNRIHNMELACTSLNGVLLPPRSALSLRQLLGDPTTSRGYRLGPVLQDGRVGTSAGGGLCQVSTVLFNAALLAGLEILERHAHSSDPWGENRAFPLGLDATFVHGRLDLKVRNPYAFPVQLAMSLSEGSDALEAAFMAPQEFPTPVIQTEVLECIEAPRETWMPGWQVETCRWNAEGRITYRAISNYAPTPKPGGPL